MTTKKLYFNSVAHELLWFLKGTGNIEYLAQNNVHIWDEWPFKAYLEKNDLPIPEVNSPEWCEQMKEFIDRVATDHEFALRWGNLESNCMACSGVGGRMARVGKSIKSLKPSKPSNPIQIHAATSSPPGIQRKLMQSPKREVCRHAIRYFNSMCAATSSICISTSAQQIHFWACRLMSRRTHCSSR